MPTFHDGRLNNSQKRQLEQFSVMSEVVDIEEIIRSSEKIILALDRKDPKKVLGFITLQPPIDSLPARIQFIEVLPEFQRQKIGKKLLQKIIDYATERKYKSISLMVISNRSFFEKFCFRTLNNSDRLMFLNLPKKPLK